jgi:hypothetical protein
MFVKSTDFSAIMAAGPGRFSGCQSRAGRGMLIM